MTIHDPQHFASIDHSMSSLRESCRKHPTLFCDALQLALAMSKNAGRANDLTAQTVAYFAVLGMTIFNRIEMERLQRELRTQ